MTASAGAKRFVCVLSVALSAPIVPRTAAAETVIEDATITATIEAACTVTGGVLDFGDYDPRDAAVVRATALITLDCPENTDVSIRLDGGENPEGGERRMAGGRGEFLRYNLYTDRHRVQVWGDGLGFGEPVVTTFESLNPNRTVFGQLPAQQAVSGGAYSDTVTITVTVNATP